MGFYDRDYQRGGYYGQQPGMNLGGPQTMAVRLVIITAGIYVAQLFTGGQDGFVTRHFSLNADWYRQPWLVYQLLTYGFLHDASNLWHIAVNMFVLWMFGRDVEYRYGQREFLAFYLLAIIFAGLVWSLMEVARPGSPVLLGASGGIAAIVILFAMNFPHRTVLFMFVVPMPMWLLAVIVVGIDAWNAMARPDAGVAFTAHLGGAFFGFLYYQGNWRLARWLPTRDWTRRLRPKPKLRVVDSDEVDNTDRRVDEILKKIQEHGQDSLTRRERRILEQASREYQKRKGG